MAYLIRFALTPAVAVQGIIDYNTAEGRKLYIHATSKLDDELSFSGGNPENPGATPGYRPLDLNILPKNRSTAFT